MNKTVGSILLYGIPSLLVVALLAFVVLAPEPAPDNENTEEEGNIDVTEPLTACIQHTNIALHIHSDLTILANGVKQDIPENIGIDPDCMHPVHTHDTTGKIHMEYLEPIDFTLGDFFHMWERSFSKDQVLDFKADATHRIVLRVNGEESDQYENLVLKDNDKVEISYEEIK